MNLTHFATMDPNLLFSLVNTKLRDDFNGDLEQLAVYYEIDKSALIQRLSEAGFEFLAEAGQFR